MCRHVTPHEITPLDINRTFDAFTPAVLDCGAACQIYDNLATEYQTSGIAVAFANFKSLALLTMPIEPANVVYVYGGHFHMTRALVSP